MDQETIKRELRRLALLDDGGDVAVPEFLEDVPEEDLKCGIISDVVAKALGNFLGTYLFSDEYNNYSGPDSCMRIKVRLDVRKSLHREKSVKKPNKEILVRFKYEKLPTFCFLCGRIGHIDRYCPIRWRFPEGVALIKLWDASLRAPIRRLSREVQSPYLVPTATEKRAAELWAGGSGLWDIGVRQKPTNIQELEKTFRTSMREMEATNIAFVIQDERKKCKSRAVLALTDLVKVHRPNVVFLIETLVDRARIEEIRVKLKFEGCFSVDIQGRSGGLGFLWRAGITANLINYSRHCINMHVKGTHGEDFWLTGFYGEPDRTRRGETWDLLRSLSISEAWCLVGDYNELLAATEKKGMNHHPQRLIDNFQSAAEDCDLIDVALEGHQFTWWKSKGTPEAVEERLDRVVANAAWHTLYPYAKLVNMVASASDHSPLVLYTNREPPRGQQRLLRFENWWKKETLLKPFVEKVW
ncbi:hypothetical protein LINGRAHAP2_LOCUS34659 [Linum grandiflorum]